MTYVITITREFYGPSKSKSLVLRQDGQRAERFATLAHARAVISALDDERYYLGHNESSRPTYKAVRVDALPAYLSSQT